MPVVIALYSSDFASWLVWHQGSAIFSRVTIDDPSTRKLSNIEYADDFMLLKEDLHKWQALGRLDDRIAMAVIRFAVHNCKTRSPGQIGSNLNLVLGWKELGEVDGFSYFGGCISLVGCISGDVSKHTHMRWLSFINLRHLWYPTVYQRSSVHSKSEIGATLLVRNVADENKCAKTFDVCALFSSQYYQNIVGEFA